MRVVKYASFGERIAAQIDAVCMIIDGFSVILTLGQYDSGLHSRFIFSDLCDRLCAFGK